jgi:hypothetical protein
LKKRWWSEGWRGQERTERETLDLGLLRAERILVRVCTTMLARLEYLDGVIYGLLACKFPLNGLAIVQFLEDLGRQR